MRVLASATTICGIQSLSSSPAADVSTVVRGGYALADRARQMIALVLEPELEPVRERDGGGRYVAPRSAGRPVRFRVQSRVSDLELAAVRHGDEHAPLPGPRVQVEEPVEAPETAGRLAASEPSVAVGHCEQPVAANSPLPELEDLERSPSSDFTGQRQSSRMAASAGCGFVFDDTLGEDRRTG